MSTSESLETAGREMIKTQVAAYDTVFLVTMG